MSESWISRLWKGIRGTKTCEVVIVSFDKESVKVEFKKPADVKLSRSFKWKDVIQVCFYDEGLMASDTIIIRTKDEDIGGFIPTEAAGAQEFIEELLKRDLFPDELLKTFAGDTSGGIYCWPPKEEKDAT